MGHRAGDLRGAVGVDHQRVWTTTTSNDGARPPRAGLFVSTLRRIIADVHGVPDFLDPPEILQVMQDPDHPARA